MADRVAVISINTTWNIINFRLGLVRGLQAAGYEVVALTPGDKFAADLASHGIRHVPIAIDQRGVSPIDDLRLLFRYWRALGQIRPAAYLGYTIKPNIWGSIAARCRGIPVINNIAGLGETFARKGILNSIVRRLYRIGLRGSSTIFFQNPDDRALFVDAGIVDPARTQLLPGSGIDPSHFSPPASRAERAGRPFRFLLMARLLWAKGIGDLVAAAKMLPPDAPDFRIQILGLAQEGRGAIDQATLQEWASEPIVELLTPTDDVRPVLAAADCFVLPTYYPEGTPRALLEAGAMALPIITTDVPGCREIVRDGENGFLIAPQSPRILAQRMQDVMSMPDDVLARLGNNSRHIAETEFHENIVVERYIAAMKSCVKAE